MMAVEAMPTPAAVKPLAKREADLSDDRFGAWLTAAAKRLHHNVLAAALANKLARITWTVLAQGRSYEARVEPRTA
jgi:transposase